MLEVDEPHPDKLLHREITEKIIGAAFEVHRELGYGGFTRERCKRNCSTAQRFEGDPN
ncbi:MAG: hypothetical protein ACREP1_02380 [Rhodanobacteraceae bacterium]